MPCNTPGLASGQMWQHVELRRGTRYEVSCRIRWDNHQDADQAPITNFGLYDERSDTWYGPIDISLHPTTAWRTHRFTHVPPSDGVWKLYVGINAWGNNGRALTVSVDDVSCRALNAMTQPVSKPQFL